MNKKTAILLLNLGTPDAPTPAAVRRYLHQFLSDQRVVEIPPIIWQILLFLLVLPRRSRRVAHAYASIWQNPWGDDSPMRAILSQQAVAVAEQIGDQWTDVYPVMTYGNPSVKKTVAMLCAKGIGRLIVLPLYPQYSATSTGAAFDAVMRTLMGFRNVPEVVFIKDYHDHPLYIQALAASVHEFWAKNGRADKLLMSFHGIPQPFADKGDPYPVQCHATARLLAQALALPDDAWAISFQSRFGAQEWLRPYTDELLHQMATSGITSVQVLSPAFSADCLETLEELAVENREHFLQAGGQHYAYIPALNTRLDHVALMVSLLERYL